MAGDFNGDGKTDLVFNSTCQKTNFVDSTCTVGDANLVYTALSNGLGGFTLSAKQTYGASGWADYPYFADLIGDVNGDGRSDLVWSSSRQSVAKTNNNQVVVGFANPDGTFQLGSVQNFGSAWTGSLTLADLNRDGKADLIWNNAPLVTRMSRMWIPMRPPRLTAMARSRPWDRGPFTPARVFFNFRRPTASVSLAPV